MIRRNNCFKTPVLPQKFPINTKNAVLTNLPMKHSKKVKKNLSPSGKLSRNIYMKNTTLNVPKYTWNVNSTTLQKIIFAVKPQTFLWMSEMFLKIDLFQKISRKKNNFSLILSQRFGRIDFWQPRSSKFRAKAEIFPLSDTDKNSWFFCRKSLVAQNVPMHT